MESSGLPPLVCLATPTHLCKAICKFCVPLDNLSASPASHHNCCTGSRWAPTSFTQVQSDSDWPPGPTMPFTCHVSQCPGMQTLKVPEVSSLRNKPWVVLRVCTAPQKEKGKEMRKGGRRGDGRKKRERGKEGGWKGGGKRFAHE